MVYMDPWNKRVSTGIRPAVNPVRIMIGGDIYVHQSHAVNGQWSCQLGRSMTPSLPPPPTLGKNPHSEDIMCVNDSVFIIRVASDYLLLS